MTKTITKAQAEKALEQVAAWLGKRGYGGVKCACGQGGLNLDSLARHPDGSYCQRPKLTPAPTGEEAARNGEGPMLNMEWDWPSSGPTPTIILEGGPYDWAYEAGFAVKVPGVFAEPYAGYALCLYPD